MEKQNRERKNMEIGRKIGNSVRPPPYNLKLKQTQAVCMHRCKHTHTALWGKRDGNGHVWNGKGATVWHTDFSWVAGDGNSISKTSRRLCKTLESGFLPADHRQLLHTLINHMQMSLQRHWGMIRRLSPLVEREGKKNAGAFLLLQTEAWRREVFLRRVTQGGKCWNLWWNLKSVLYFKMKCNCVFFFPPEW